MSAREEARARGLTGGREVRSGAGVRVSGDGTRAASAGWTLTGTAAVFKSEAVIAGLFREVIERGAFSGVLDDPVVALVNHDANLLLGRSPGTLSLRQDSVGLHYEGPLDPSNPVHAAARSSLRRGDMRESSFAFSVAEELWEEPRSGKGLPLRRIVRVGRLYDVSPVVFPAYEGTASGVRTAVAEEFARAAMTRRHARRERVFRP